MVKTKDEWPHSFRMLCVKFPNKMRKTARRTRKEQRQQETRNKEDKDIPAMKLLRLLLHESVSACVCPPLMENPV